MCPLLDWVPIAEWELRKGVCQLYAHSRYCEWLLAQWFKVLQATGLRVHVNVCEAF